MLLSAACAVRNALILGAAAMAAADFGGIKRRRVILGSLFAMRMKRIVVQSDRKRRAADSSRFQANQIEFRQISLQMARCDEPLRGAKTIKPESQGL